MISYACCGVRVLIAGGVFDGGGLVGSLITPMILECYSTCSNRFPR